jgi:hypothetical protein
MVRDAVERSFHIIKNVFAWNKAGYRGFARNAAQLFGLFGLANLVNAFSATAN